MVAVERADGEIVIAFEHNDVLAFCNHGVLPDGFHGNSWGNLQTI
jgi:hypothetical protein